MPCIARVFCWFGYWFCFVLQLVLSFVLEFSILAMYVGVFFAVEAKAFLEDSFGLKAPPASRYFVVPAGTLQWQYLISLISGFLTEDRYCCVILLYTT